MSAFVNINSSKDNEVHKFLNKVYDINFTLKGNYWSKKFSNPIEIAELIGIYIDNSEFYNISFWISLDTGVLIKVDNSNANEIIKYLYERYPY